jgi:hypothetical protein
MNQDVEKLKLFIILFKSMRAMEDALIELEEFDVPYSFSKFFYDYCELSKNIDEKININNLTKDKLNKYKQLNIGIIKRLKWDSYSLYEITRNIEDIFYESYISAEKAIEKILNPYENKERPFFLCGLSSFKLYIPEESFLGIIIKEMIDIKEYFTYSGGYLDINTTRFTNEFKLNYQEYQIYEAAYKACMDVLNERLNLKGTVSSRID